VNPKTTPRSSALLVKTRVKAGEASTGFNPNEYALEKGVTWKIEKAK
jgi:hypothetical protein